MGEVGPSRGEIWLHERPDRKARPVVILTRDEAVDNLNKLLAVPATTTIRGLRTEVELGPNDGMQRTSVLSLDNTFLAHKNFLTRRIGALGASKLSELCRALDAATGC